MSSSLPFKTFLFHGYTSHWCSYSFHQPFSKNILGAILEDCYEEYNCSIMSWINMNWMIQRLLSIRLLEFGIASWATEESISYMLGVKNVKKKIKKERIIWLLGTALMLLFLLVIPGV